MVVLMTSLVQVSHAGIEAPMQSVSVTNKTTAEVLLVV